MNFTRNFISVLQNSALVIVSIVLVLLLVEAALWVFHLPPYPDGVHNVLQNDEKNGYKFRPNAVSSRSSSEFDTPVIINSIGLRDYASVDENSKPYAFLLGDSFAEGHGVNVEQTIAKRLQDKTGKLVANLGIGSSGTIQQVNIFRRYLDIISQKPMYAILVFYVGNDYYDNRRFSDHFTSTGRPLQTVSNGYLVDDGTSIVQDGNWLVLYTEDGKEVRRSKNPQFHPPKGYENKYLDWSKIYNIFAWSNTPRNKNCQLSIAIAGLFDSSYDFSLSSEWKITKQALTDFIRIAKENDIIPVLAIMPSKFQLNPTLLSNVGCNIERLDAYQSIDVLKKYANDNGLININLAPIFTALPPKEFDKLYYFKDSHLTPWGNEFTASAILEILK
jgi:hypothetical protein